LLDISKIRLKVYLMSNPVLETIKKRRSIVRFESTPIEKEKVEAVLEAGQWAPSFLNKQPWKFIVVTDRSIKEQLSQIVPTAFTKAIVEAPVCIAVAVDTEEDSFHFVEDGAIATQNMALAAHSLGLYSCWIGVFNLRGEKNSSEIKIKKVLDLPKAYRVISLLPIGHPLGEIPKKSRKVLEQLVYQEKFDPTRTTS